MGLKRRTMRPSWYLTSVVVLLMFQCLTLGGDDFDKRIVDWLAANFKRDEGIDLLKDKQALQRLTETAEKAKMELSTLTQTSISLPFITATADGPKHIETTITRAKFEELCSDLLDRLRTPVENSLRDAKLSFKDLDEVILVGGSTRIPAIQELVKKLTGKDPNVTIRAGLGGEMRILCFVLKFKILCFNIIIVLRFEKNVLKFEKVELFIIFCIDI